MLPTEEEIGGANLMPWIGKVPLANGEREVARPRLQSLVEKCSDTDAAGHPSPDQSVLE